MYPGPGLELSAVGVETNSVWCMVADNPDPELVPPMSCTDDVGVWTPLLDKTSYSSWKSSWKYTFAAVAIACTGYGV